MARASVLAGMAGKGRVYRVRDNQNWELLFDFDEQQALTLALRDGKLAFVGTGNIGNGYAIDPQKARDGEFTSEVRDCRFLTTWGNLFWMGERGDIGLHAHGQHGVARLDVVGVVGAVEELAREGGQPARAVHPGARPTRRRVRARPASR